MEKFIFRKIKMHAKLIRTHTVATGADSCDYWYVPDQSETVINYTGVIL